MKMHFVVRVLALCVMTLAPVYEGESAVATSNLPCLYLIGDSTVKNGSGNGAGGLWGWGQVISEHFDKSKIRIANRALGGRSSRTFLTEGLWAKVEADLKPGDFVLMQFGHNDGGELATGDRPRASLKGNGDEIRDVVVEKIGKAETVHSYGWYLRKYIAETKAKGATPIVLSLVPRNNWKNGKVARSSGDYAKWAAEAAKATGAAFIDLNELVASRYEAETAEVVGRDYFTAKDHTHTTEAGARVNAQCVVQGLRALPGCALVGFLLDEPGHNNSPKKQALLRFSFGDGEYQTEPGYKKVTSTSRYSKESGFGFLPGASVETITRSDENTPGARFVTSDKPFLFSVSLPEGNYRVALTLGDIADTSDTTVKAESRRLMLEKVHTEKGETVTREFTVNIRRPDLPAGERVRLKERERNCLHWDDQLTLEFNGARPCLVSMEIHEAPEAITVYLAGDSTVTDQPAEPWNSWGQMLPRFFKKDVAVANHAESGESIKSSLGAHRFEKIFSTIKPGDYLFFQFGHNDMKDRATNALAVYKANLEKLVDETRKHGAIPVLVTSMERKSGVQRDTLSDYPQTVRNIAQDKKVALIDLHALSKRLYTALDNKLDKAFQDGTHHNNYGSYQLAKCIIESIRSSKMDLARFIVSDFTGYDPGHPDSPDEFIMPASPQADRTKPDGN